MAWLTAAGHRLEYEQIAGPGAVTLVFLHEGLGSLRGWRDFPAKVARETGCPALVYSRAGYGESDPVSGPRGVDFMHREAREALPEVLAAAGVGEVILVGHSDGASIALIYAAEQGERVRGMVLEAPHVFVEEVCVEAITRVRAEYAATDLREKLARRHTHVDATFHGWVEIWLDPAFRAWNLESLLPAVRAPVLVIQGEGDEYGTLAQVDAVCAGVSGPRERVVLAACGHAPHRDQPEATLAAMVGFVKGIVAPPVKEDR